MRSITVAGALALALALTVARRRTGCGCPYLNASPTPLQEASLLPLGRPLGVGKFLSSRDPHRLPLSPPVVRDLPSFLPGPQPPSDDTGSTFEEPRLTGGAFFV
jgi:hypothetical protein